MRSKLILAVLVIMIGLLLSGCYSSTEPSLRNKKEGSVKREPLLSFWSTAINYARPLL